MTSSSTTTASENALSGPAYDRFTAFQRFPTLIRGGNVVAVWAEDTLTYTDESGETPINYRVDLASGEKKRVAKVEKVEKIAAPLDLLALMAQPAHSPDGRYSVSAAANNLTLKWKVDGRTVALTETGTEDLSWAPALAAPGSAKNVLWAPNSSRFVAALTDTEGVHRSPVLHWLKPHEEIEWRLMPRNGEAQPRTELYIVDVIARTTTLIEGTGLRDHRYFPMEWSADGARYLFLRMDRRMQQLDLLAADAISGATEILITDMSETFIAGIDFLMRYPRYLRQINGGEQLLWISERSGWDQLYLYDAAGKLQRQLTDGEFVVLNIVEVDESAGWVYFTAHTDADRPYDVHLCRVNLDGTGFAQLTEGAGCHDGVSMLFTDPYTRVVFSPSKEYFIDSWSSPTQAPRSELRRADGTLVTVLSEANIDALLGAGYTVPEEFTSKAADGVTDLYGVLFRPAAYDDSQSYPIVDYIYNGPFISWVPHTFIACVTNAAARMAQAGFVGVVVDGRGTPDRGKAFQDVVYMNWGRHEIADHEAAIRGAAATRGYMDLDRVGLFGGSWGGYMTQRGLLQAPDFYKVGVSAAPVCDLYDHVPNLEWYLGSPQEQRDVYDYASNLRLVDELKGRLLLIHGTDDLANAPFSSTMKLVHALIQADKQFDLLVVPEMGHGPATPEHHKHYWDRHFRYFTDHLLPRERAIAQ